MAAYVTGQAIIFSSCSFFFLLFLSFYLFPRLFSAVADWMSTILPDVVSPSCQFRMQVWNVLHAARWKYRTQRIAKNSPYGPSHKLGLYLRNYAYIDNRKKIVKQQYLLHMLSQYGELRSTNGWDLFTSLHPSKFRRVSRLGNGSVTAWHFGGSGRQPNFAALNRGRHLYSAGGHHIGHWPTF